MKILSFTLVVSGLVLGALSNQIEGADVSKPAIYGTVEDHLTSDGAVMPRTERGRRLMNQNLRYFARMSYLMDEMDELRWDEDRLAMRQNALLEQLVPEQGVVAGGSGNGGVATPVTLEVFFERHVESVSNTESFNLLLGRRKSEKDAPPSIKADGSTTSEGLKGEIEGVGLKQLKAIEQSFAGKCAPQSDWANPDLSFRFETSTLRRAQLTAIYARESLINAAVDPIKQKLIDAPFLINGAMRESSGSGAAESMLDEKWMDVLSDNPRDKTGPFEDNYLKHYLRAEDYGRQEEETKKNSRWALLRRAWAGLKSLGQTDFRKKYFPGGKDLMPDGLVEKLMPPDKNGNHGEHNLFAAMKKASVMEKKNADDVPPIIANMGADPKQHMELDQHVIRLLNSAENTGKKKLVVFMTGHGRKFANWINYLETDAACTGCSELKSAMTRGGPKGPVLIKNGQLYRMELVQDGAHPVLHKFEKVWDGPEIPK